MDSSTLVGVGILVLLFAAAVLFFLRPRRGGGQGGGGATVFIRTVTMVGMHRQMDTEQTGTD